MAFVRNPVVYVPDLTNGRPIVDGKVYLLTAGTVPPTQDSAINPADLLTVSYVNEAGNTVTQSQPLYTSKGGCLYGSFPEEARQYMIAPQEYVFVAYDRRGKLQYSAETFADDYVESAALASSISTVLVGGVEARDLSSKGYAEGLIDTHNQDPEAHPELTLFITQEADRAESAADLAESAADVATLGAGLFPDVATGLASVAEGDYFNVPSSVDVKYITLYRKVSGLAVEIKSYPSTEAVNDVLGVYPLIDDWLDITIDVDGNFAYGTKNDGSDWLANNGIVSKQVSTLMDEDSGAIKMPDWAFLDFGVPLVEEWSYLTLDSENNFVSGSTKEGDIYESINGVVTLISGGSSAEPSIVNSYDYDYLSGIAVNNDENIDYLVIVNGQSWAEGAKSGTVGDATVTTTAQHPGYALMFNSGTKPNGASLTSYVDLKEAETSLSFETICSGAADVVITRCNAAIGRKPRVIFAIAALGGQAYFDTRSASNGLKKGTATYAEAIRLVKGAYDLSRAAGKRLVVLAQVVLHGEQDFTNDTSVENYQRALNAWQSDFETDCQYITGQKEPVSQYVTQVNRGGTSIGTAANPAIAQLEAPRANHKIRCIGPMYQAPGGTDGAHLTGVGYRMVGRIVGDFICNDLLGAYQSPLQVVEYWRASSATIHLKYNRPITVESTDALVNVSGLGAGKGVAFTDGSGSPVTVTGIAVDGSNADTLIVTLSGAWTGPRPRLFIAAWRQGGGSGATNGARSGIRSTDPFDTDSLTGQTQYYWACQQIINL